MNRRVVRGALALAVSLAVAGAAASSIDWEPANGAHASGTAAALDAQPQIQPQAPLADELDVPIRSGRLDDEAELLDSHAPVEVRVAGIGLEAPVISVGVDENSQFDVPTADKVGWYQYSSTPGEQGASVLAAHVDYGGKPGAFFNLRLLLPGETLEVEMSDGSVHTYEVTGNTIYDKTELPADDLFRKDGDPVLQLITCGGTFDPEARSYEANLVVTALPVSA